MNDDRASHSQSPERNDGRYRLYLLLTLLALFLLALLWSIDTSIIYIVGGVFVFFLFLTLRNWFNANQTNKQSFGEPDPYSTHVEQSAFSLTDFFRKFKSKKQPGFSAPSPTTTYVAKIIGFSIVGFFIAILSLLLLFITGDDFSENALIDYQRGQDLYLTGQYDSAKVYYRKAMRANPEYADAIAGYGNMLSLTGQGDSALLMLNYALEIEPEHDAAQYYKGWYYYNKHDYENSLLVLTELVDRNPDYTDAKEFIGSVYYALEKYDEALQWLNLAYEAGQRGQWICHVMAYLNDIKGNTANAIELYKEALTFDNSTITIHERLGELLPGDEGEYYQKEAMRLKQLN